jgi:predicted unusual protein kinase regulating ubiquinone biosynthesis (AarF/ABC1/UbiB family)
VLAADQSEVSGLRPSNAARRIQRAVAKGLRRWPGWSGGAADGSAPLGADAATEPPAAGNGNGDALARPPGVVAALPRRPQISVSAEEEFAPPPMRQTEVFETSVWRALGRLFVWVGALASFVARTTWDRVRGLDTIERRAVRLRETLQHVGGTFIKFGQQLSVRVDVLPYPYCRELIKMLDRVPPFATAEAIATIERATGRPISETFAVFDPEPIGSASLACVYQAQLFSGERVAVKVRRPRIGERFAADLRALDWLLILAEKLTFVRPGFTVNLRQDLRQTLFEELDFRKEARYQDLFRRRAKKKSARHFFSAPRVYFALSNEEVIVQEFASGLWLWELIEIVDRQDPEGLAYIRRLDIDPKVVAERLHWVAMWGMFTDLFFHADPHPANVIVRPHNHVVFIDFGSCGAYEEGRRTAMQQLLYHQQHDDVAGMVQASLHLLEPLPPIDVTELARELQHLYRQRTYAQRSKATMWFERSSAGLFFDMIGLSRKFKIPMNSDVLRIARANLLYDTLAARLHARILQERVYRRFVRDVGGQARKRVRKSILRRLARGPTPSDYLAVEKTVYTANRVFYRLQRFLDNPGLKLPYLVEKWVYAASTAIQLGLLVAALTVAVAGVLSATRLYVDQPAEFPAMVRRVVANGWFQLVVLGLGLLNIRKILFRLNDKRPGE